MEICDGIPSFARSSCQVLSLSTYCDSDVCVGDVCSLFCDAVLTLPFILLMKKESSGIGPVKQINLREIAIIFLSISLNMCFGCSKEPSHRDGSFEYSQHMFWLRNKKNNF